MTIFHPRFNMTTPLEKTDLLKNLEKKLFQKSRVKRKYDGKDSSLLQRKTSLGIQRHKVKHSKNKIAKDRIPATRPVNRVTVKHGIFPQMIRTKFLKKQFNQIRFGAHAGYEDSNTLLNPDRMGEIVASPRSSDNNEDILRSVVENRRCPDSVANYSCDLTQRADQWEEGLRVFRTPVDAIRKESKASANCSFIDDHNYRQEEEERTPKLKYDRMIRRVTQIETCSSAEAQQIFLYQQFTDSINRVMIVERETNFEEFPDAMETLKNELRALKIQRTEETRIIRSHVLPKEKNVFVTRRISEKRLSKNSNNSFMDVDEDIICKFQNDVPKENKHPSSISSIINLITDDEDDDFKFQETTRRNAKIVFDRKQETARNVALIGKTINRDEPKVIFKDALKPRRADNGVKMPQIRNQFVGNNNLFDVRRKETNAEFLFDPKDMPSFVIPDTIDQNAGLEGVEYLKNVSKSRFIDDDHRTWDRNDIDNRMNIWRMPSKTYGEQNVIHNDPRRQWRNPSPLFPSTTATSRVEFPLPGWKIWHSPPISNEKQDRFQTTKRCPNFGENYADTREHRGQTLPCHHQRLTCRRNSDNDRQQFVLSKAFGNFKKNDTDTLSEESFRLDGDIFKRKTANYGKHDSNLFDRSFLTGNKRL